MNVLARLIVVILVLFQNGAVLYGQSSCSDLITYTYENNYRLGKFKVDFPKSSNDSFVQVVVYASDECKRGFCKLFANTSREMATEDYKNKEEVSYLIQSANAALNVTVEGVALKTSSNCRIICGRENRHSKMLTYTLYPFGRENVREPECSLIRASYYGDADCGVVSYKNGIQRYAVGGEEIPRGSWPWLVALYRNNERGSRFLCGASLISQKVVLTAAHCVFEGGNELKPEDIVLHMGRHNRSNELEQGYVKYEVSLTQVHPDYRHSESSFDSDIALVYTDTNVKYTDFISPACLWDDNEPIEDLISRNGVVVGWGTDETADISPVPKRVTTTIVSHKECYGSNLAFAALSTKRNFCAGLRDGTGPCTGDSGGALMIHASGRWIIRGIVDGTLRGTNEECDLFQYAIYADVTKYKNWILNGLPSFREKPVTPAPVMESEMNCGVVPPNYESDGAWPWDVRLGVKLPSFDIPIEVGGTLLSQNVIITRASDLYVGNPDKVLIRWAPFNRGSWDVTTSEYYVHPDYDPPRGREVNVAIVKFKGTDFPGYVVPPCLWAGSPKIEDMVGREIQATCLSMPNNPSEKFITKVLDRKECDVTDQKDPDPKPKYDFCVDFRIPLCDPEDGSGFYVYENGKWMLRGVSSTDLLPKGKVLILVTDIVPLLPWIKQHLSS